MADKTDTRALFDALGPAYDAVQAKTEQRDTLASDLREAHNTLVTALEVSDAKAADALATANADLSEATSALKALQGKLAGLIGTVSDPNRLR